MKLLRAAGMMFGGLVLIAVVTGAAWLGSDRGRRWWVNRDALSDGADVARQVLTPDGVADLMAQRPELASVAVFDVDDPDGGVYADADRPRPVVELSHLVVASAYAHAIASGTHSADAGVAPAELERLDFDFSPGERLARARAEKRPTPVTLANMVAAMMVNDWAAGDVLMLELGREALEAEVQRLGIAGLSAPAPFAGDDAMLLEDQVAGSSPNPDRSWALAARLRSDEVWGQKLRLKLREDGPPSFKKLREHRRATSSLGTARGYAKLLGRIATDPSPWGEQMRGLIEWTGPGRWRATYEVGGSSGGVSTSVHAFTGYGRPVGGKLATFAILLEDLPHLAWVQLDRKPTHSELMWMMVRDPEARRVVAGILADGGHP